MFKGTSILGSARGSQTGAPNAPSLRGGIETGAAFYGVNPVTGEQLEPVYFSASNEEIDKAAALAEAAFSSYSKLTGRERGAFLRNIADGLQAITEDLVQRAHQETALPIPRLQGEVARTANQLRLFAEVVEEGSWVMARIDTADPERKPLPKPDIRSMLVPLGPVAVFGASNFPLAFSVAGGDTASALAAGNPVIVKAHPAHPGTSELAAEAILEAARASGAPDGVFSLLFDSGVEIGAALVRHPAIRAVGFTGSLAAGRRLMDLAAARAEPIPVFAEMGSVNPVFVLPEALAERGAALAAGLHASATLGAGQFCTKPGLVFLPGAGTAATSFTRELAQRIQTTPPATLLTRGIAEAYCRGVDERAGHAGVELLAKSAAPISTALFQVSSATLAANPKLEEELFGPALLLVRYGDEREALEAARRLPGQLTATLHATETDLRRNAGLVALLETKAGRLIVNGYPTGVEVSHAIVHGGPYPATSDSRATSVGTRAIFRFARPVCYQDAPEFLLPQELRDANPLGIWRLVDGEWTRAGL